MYVFTCGTQVLKQRLKRAEIPPATPYPTPISSGSFSLSLFYQGNAQKLPVEISLKTHSSCVKDTSSQHW